MRISIVLSAVFALVVAATVVSGGHLYRLSGRHPNDLKPAGPIILNVGPFAVKDGGKHPWPKHVDSLQPSPIPAGEAPLGGDFVDNGDQAGPSDPTIDWGTLSEQAQQYFEQIALTGQGWQSGPSLYKDGFVKLDVDLTGMFPPSVVTQGECNSCWAYGASEHLQAVLMKQGYLQGPWMSITAPEPPKIYPDQLMYHRISTQQFIDCSTPTGCNGGAVVDGWRWLLNATNPIGGVVPFENYPTSVGGGSQSCQPIIPVLLPSGESIPPPVYQPGAQTAWHVVPPCFDHLCPGSLETEEALAQWMSTTGIPVVIYVDASQWQNATNGVIFPSTNCNSSGVHSAESSHVVQIVGHGTDADGNRFWLIRNSWGVDWGEGGHIRLEFGQNACGMMNYAVQADVPPPYNPMGTDKSKSKVPLTKFAEAEQHLRDLAKKFGTVGAPNDACVTQCTTQDTEDYAACAKECTDPECPAACAESAAEAMESCNQVCNVCASEGNADPTCRAMCLKQEANCHNLGTSLCPPTDPTCPSGVSEICGEGMNSCYEACCILPPPTPPPSKKKTLLKED